jgi:hypothetical protein
MSVFDNSPPAVVSIGLSTFCKIAKELDVDLPYDDAPFIDFVTRGRYAAPNGTIQVRLDMNEHRLPRRPGFSLIWDFDSLLGITKSLRMIETALTIFPLPDPNRTLRKSIHIRETVVSISSVYPTHNPS